MKIIFFNVSCRNLFLLSFFSERSLSAILVPLHPRLCFSPLLSFAFPYYSLFSFRGNEILIVPRAVTKSPGIFTAHRYKSILPSTALSWTQKQQQLHSNVGVGGSCRNINYPLSSYPVSTNPPITSTHPPTYLPTLQNRICNPNSTILPDLFTVLAKAIAFPAKILSKVNNI